jgi:hypothetical protein
LGPCADRQSTVGFIVTRRSERETQKRFDSRLSMSKSGRVTGTEYRTQTKKAHQNQRDTGGRCRSSAIANGKAAI